MPISKMNYMCQAEIPRMFLVRLDQVTSKVVRLSLIHDVQSTNKKKKIKKKKKKKKKKKTLFWWRGK